MINRKALFTSLLLSFAFALPSMAFSISQRIQIDHVIDKRNVAITHPETGVKYLVHVGNGCGDMREGQYVYLSTQGALGSSGDDLIRVDNLHTCKIDQVDLYTHRIYVDYTNTSNTEARVIDENGQQFKMIYPNSCAGIRNYRLNYIYTRQGSDTLSTSDQVLLPYNEGRCSLSYVDPVESNFIFKADTPSTANKRPSMATDVKAFAGNRSVFLNWRAADDDKAVDHYLIGVSRGYIDARSLSVDAFKNLEKSTGTSHTVSGLFNDRTYYFYVIAVDAEGLMSSDWSTAVSATPKSAIFRPEKPADDHTDMNVRISKEAYGSFRIKWDPIVGADRYTVIFEVDGEREWVKTDYNRTYARILKRSHRKGKELKMTIRAYLPKDYVEEQSIEFDF